MPVQNVQGIGERRVNRGGGHPIVMASSAFVAGLAAGLFARSGKHMLERAWRGLWHRGADRTIVYDENLPDSLARREPAPDAGQPRFGGTGAIGVSPAAVATAQQEDAKNRR
jgi:hypothetical protein